jgi:hypothetical protein
MMQSNSTSGPDLRFDSIRADERGLAEMDASAANPRPLVFVPRADIRSLEVTLASGAERPLVVATLGIVVMLVALFPFAFLAVILVYGGQMEAELFYMSVSGVVGAWLLWFAFKRRLVILVHTVRGRRKLVLSRSTEPAAAQDFVEQVCRAFGHTLGHSLHLR